ncbi:hypothetical protein, partial [Pseudomonas sp. 2995-1]|uniref:hypothetical protein n=1 Tax=Pseudomonas sp. 2995-1 TaxID=1712679 RepID=UPI000C57F083
MQELTKTEKAFKVLDNGADIIQKELSLTYLDSLAEMGEMVFQGNVTTSLSDKSANKLTLLIDELK